MEKLTEEEREDPGAIKDYNRGYNKLAQSEDNWEDSNKKGFNIFTQHCTHTMLTELKGVDSWDTVKANQNCLSLINLLQEITSKKSMLEVVDAERRLHLCFQRDTINLDAYTTEFKAIVQVCEAFGLRAGATEAAAKLVAEDDGINMSNTSNANKWKCYIDKSKERFQAAMHFNGLNNVIYKGPKAEVNNNWSVQWVNNTPKTISETIKKADTFIGTKTGYNASESKGLDFMQQDKESSDKGGKGRGGTGRGQG